MPKQVLPTPTEFEKIRLELVNRGFREIGSREVRNQIIRFGLRPPRRRRGRETGFVYYANGLSVFVWTTWLREEVRARKEDAGWVLISDGEKALYFAQKVHRTKYFAKHLLSRAWIAMWRVYNRPLCPQCNQWMSITRGKGMGARYWRCSQIAKHKDGKPTRLGWDKDLPLKAKLYVCHLRQKRERYRKERREKGLKVDVAVFRRKLWTSKRRFS